MKYVSIIISTALISLSVHANPLLEIWFNRNEIPIIYSESEFSAAKTNQESYKKLGIIPGKYELTYKTVNDLFNNILEKTTLIGKVNEAPIPLLAVEKFPGAFFNAGIIAFPVSYLTLLSNLDEVAFILSHELVHWANGHILKDHYLQDSSYEAADRGDKYLSRALMLYRTEQPPKNEQQADLLALKIMIHGGFNPARGIVALKKIPKVSLDLLHGDNRERYNFLKKYLKKLVFDSNIESGDIDKKIIDEIRRLE